MLHMDVHAGQQTTRTPATLEKVGTAVSYDVKSKLYEVQLHSRTSDVGATVREWVEAKLLSPLKLRSIHDEDAGVDAEAEGGEEAAAAAALSRIHSSGYIFGGCEGTFSAGSLQDSGGARCAFQVGACGFGAASRMGPLHDPGLKMSRAAAASRRRPKSSRRTGRTSRSSYSRHASAPSSAPSAPCHDSASDPSGEEGGVVVVVGGGRS